MWVDSQISAIWIKHVLPGTNKVALGSAPAWFNGRISTGEYHAVQPCPTVKEAHQNQRSIPTSHSLKLFNQDFQDLQHQRQAVQARQRAYESIARRNKRQFLLYLLP